MCCWDLKECEGRPKVNYVTVFERPGLREFLKQLGEFADLVLFTAGLEGLLIAFNRFKFSCFVFLCVFKVFKRLFGVTF